jgi:hypothetical protein
LRWVSESASSGLRGSSMMMKSAPRPVSTPPTELRAGNRFGWSETLVQIASEAQVGSETSRDTIHWSSGSGSPRNACWLDPARSWHRLIWALGLWPRIKAAKASAARMGFKRAGRYIDDGSSDLPKPACFQFRCDQLIVPVAEK